MQAGRRTHGEQPWGEVLGVLIGEKLDVSQQCGLQAQMANSILGCISRGVAGCPPLVCLHGAFSGVLCQGLGPQCRKDVGVGARGGPGEYSKDEHLSGEERLRELGWFSLEKGRFWGHLIVAFLYLKGAYSWGGRGRGERSV